MIPLQLHGVEAIEVVGAEIREVHVVTKQMEGDDQDAVGDGNRGAFRTASPADAAVLRP